MSEAIEVWVTEHTADPVTGVYPYICHLETSKVDWFRKFSYPVTLSTVGLGSLECRLGSAVLTAYPTLFDKDEANLVWCRFRGKTVVWIVEETKDVLDDQEALTEWRSVSGSTVLELTNDRQVWPTHFDPTTPNGRDPKTWAATYIDVTLANAGFELDSLSGWTAAVPTSCTVTVVAAGAGGGTGYEGSWRADLHKANGASTDHPTLSRDIGRGIGPGGMVKLSAIVNSCKGAKAFVSWLDSTGSEIRRDVKPWPTGHGNGSRQTLVFGPAPHNTEGATFGAYASITATTLSFDAVQIGVSDAQWRVIAGQHCGEMLWTLIDESNARFGAVISRGTIETDPGDLWTQRFRFDQLLDVVTDVAAKYGDVEIVGDGPPNACRLLVNYWNAPGLDLSNDVILEEAYDLLAAKHDASTYSYTGSSGPAPTFVVAEGSGEGSYVPLAVADRTAVRVVERYVDAKDAANQSLLQNRADNALADNAPVDSYTFKSAEVRYFALGVPYGKTGAAYNVGDLVGHKIPSRGIDVVQSVVEMQITVGDGEDRTRIEVSLGSPVPEGTSAAAARQQRTRQSLSQLNRQEQGQLTAIAFTKGGNFDDSETLDCPFEVPPECFLTTRATLNYRFKQYASPSKDAASGGGATSGSPDNSHTHEIFSWISDTAGAFVKRLFGLGTRGGGYAQANLETDQAVTFVTSYENAAHTHSTPNHSHALSRGVDKEAYPASHSVTCNILRDDGTDFAIVHQITGITDDRGQLDVLAWIDGPGDFEVQFVSEGGQPNGGRLGVDVWMTMFAAVGSG